MQKAAIVQKHGFGCGLACVAFAVNRSYQEVIDRVANPSSASNFGYYCKELVALLAKFGCDYKAKYVKQHIRKAIYTNDTIIFIRRSKRYPSGHYLIYYNGLWMDSWINFPKNKDVKKATAGFRKRLPGKPIYALLKQSI